MLARPPPHGCQTFASVFPAREWCNVSGRRAVRPVTIAARLGPYLRSSSFSRASPQKYRDMSPVPTSR